MKRKLIVVLAMLVVGLTAAPAFVSAAEQSGISAAVRAELAELPASVQLNVRHEWQQTGYWCGPAATRMALSARLANPPTQQSLANQLPTHTGGTDHISQVTRVLVNHVGWYATKNMPNDPPTQAQRDLLWRDIVLNMNNNYPIVANIVAPPNNRPPGYPNATTYHYFTVSGYNSDNMTVKIADSAGFSQGVYWLTFNQLATLIPPKGYSA